jgi:hypothetical protein
MTVASDIIFIGLMWQLCLLALFTYNRNRDGEMVIVSLMNLTCTLVVFFYIKVIKEVTNHYN